MAVLKPAFTKPVVAIDTLLSDRRVWRGQPASALPTPTQPTGHAALDAVLPWGGWPEAALTELLLPADGIGELRLLLPTLARLTRAGRDIAIVAPPYLPYPDGWRQAGVDFAHVHLVDANPRDALWTSEQCLRAGCLSAVLSWPMQADDRALRRLQVAADTGGVMGFVFRDARAERNPSPAALRIAILRQAQDERSLSSGDNKKPAHGELAEPSFDNLRMSDGNVPAHGEPAEPSFDKLRMSGNKVLAHGEPVEPCRAITQLRVLKCRGAVAPAHPIAISAAA